MEKRVEFEVLGFNNEGYVFMGSDRIRSTLEEAKLLMIKLKKKDKSMKHKIVKRTFTEETVYEEGW